MTESTIQATDTGRITNLRDEAEKELLVALDQFATDVTGALVAANQIINHDRLSEVVGSMGRLSSAARELWSTMTDEEFPAEGA